MALFNEKQQFIVNLKKKWKNFTREIHLSRLKEDTFSLDKRFSYLNLTNEEKQAIYSFRDNSSVNIKKARKSFGVIFGERVRYLDEARTQIEQKEIFQGMIGNVERPLIKSEK